MFGIIEFKEDAHKENLHLAHRIKEEVCELIDKLSKGEYGDRHYEDIYFDERRGGGRMGRKVHHEGYDGYGDRKYIVEMEPYHKERSQRERHQPHTPYHQFDERYNY